MDIGKELKQLRLAARLTQQNAADILIVSESTISKVENGRQDITAREYFRWKAIYANVEPVVKYTIDWPRTGVRA